MLPKQVVDLLADLFHLTDALLKSDSSQKEYNEFMLALEERTETFQEILRIYKESTIKKKLRDIAGEYEKACNAFFTAGTEEERLNSEQKLTKTFTILVYATPEIKEAEENSEPMLIPRMEKKENHRKIQYMVQELDRVSDRFASFMNGWDEKISIMRETERQASALKEALEDCVEMDSYEELRNIAGEFLEASERFNEFVNYSGEEWYNANDGFWNLWFHARLRLDCYCVENGEKHNSDENGLERILHGFLQATDEFFSIHNDTPEASVDKIKELILELNMILMDLEPGENTAVLNRIAGTYAKAILLHSGAKTFPQYQEVVNQMKLAQRYVFEEIYSNI